MRTPLLSLAAVAIETSACSGSAGSSRYTDASSAPGRHQPPPARPEEPAPTPYDGVTFQDLLDRLARMDG